MSVQPIRLFGDPVLTTKAEPVVDFDAELRRLVADLTDTMQDAPGSGLAAPQIGVGLRVFTYNVEGELGHLVNPELTLSADEQFGPEGCLSIPGLTFDCRRALSVIAKGFNMYGDPVVIEGSDLLARCIQHETDHLDGILFVDRLDTDTRKQAMKAIREADWSGLGRPTADQGLAPPDERIRSVRVVFAGTPEPAVTALKAIVASRHELVGVVTRPDAPAGRGRKLVASPVAQYAEELGGIEILKPVKPRDPDFLARLAEIAPDCCPVVAYGGLLPQAALDIPRHGWVNLHFSVLPAWRGAAPVQHAIIAGDDVTGASTFRIVKALDAGPVYGVLTEPIGPADTSASCSTGSRCPAPSSWWTRWTGSRPAYWRLASSRPTA